MNIKDCKGCYSNGKGSEVMKCSVLYNMKHYPGLFTSFPICPCANCIVKMMCNAGCKEYNIFIESIKG